MTTLSVCVRVPATSANLGPGFDMLGLALQLYSYLTIRSRAENDGDACVIIEGDGASLPGDANNISYVAAQTLLQHIDAPARDIVLHAQNNIPLSRGLGSSAAARVAGLVTANEWARAQGWRIAAPQELLSLATRLEGHPDNAAAALLGGLVVSSLREKNDNSTDVSTDKSALAIKVPVRRYPAFLVWIPESELATKKARAALPDTFSRADAVFNISRVGLLLAALATENFDALHDALHDRIHQPYRAPLMPGYQQVVKAARETGVLGATLSGAGSSVLLWLPPQNHETEVAVRRAVEEAARREGVAGKLIALPVEEQGCIVVPPVAPPQDAIR